MKSSAAAVSPAHHGHSVGFNLGVIAFAVGLLGVGVAYMIDAAGRNAHETSSVRITRTLGGKDLSIPASWFRADADRTEGFAKEIQLELKVPLGPQQALRAIDVTLMPRSQVRPSASLLDGVYLHQFMPEQLSGPVGLIGKPMMAREGYEDETVWYDALASSPFVAKCSAALVEGGPGRCLRAVYLAPGIAAVYEFDDELLMEWKRFDAELRPRLTEIGAL